MGASPLQITIAGSNFAPNATVSASNQALPVVSQTTASIVAALPQTSLAAAAALTLVVTNPGINPVPSNPYVLNVVAVPSILSITPSSAAIGSPDLTLTLSASGLLHKLFLVGENSAGTFTAVLERFDITNYVNEEQYQLPIPDGGASLDYQLVRWGQDGLALRGYDPVFGALSSCLLLLFRGPFVLPAEAAINPIPTLGAVTPGALTHNSGNQYVTAVGTGFIPGAVVLWNGTPRTTTYIDQNHLQFAVAAADVAAPSSVSLSAANPGSTPSPALALTVQ